MDLRLKGGRVQSRTAPGGCPENDRGGHRPAAGAPLCPIAAASAASQQCSGNGAREGTPQVTFSPKGK